MNKNSKIFIAGHNGLVGSAVFRNLKKHGYKNLIVISKKKLDLKNPKKVDAFFKKKKNWLYGYMCGFSRWYSCE